MCSRQKARKDQIKQKIGNVFAIVLSVVLAVFGSAPVSEHAGANTGVRTAEFVKPTPLLVSSAVIVKDSGVATIPVPPRDSTTKELSLHKRSLYFDYDSDVVKEEFRPMVSGHATYLKYYRTKRIIVQGNTDERGSREYNLALGQRRADSVKQMMTELGALGSQIETVSFGKDKPRAQRSDEAAYAENRRVDILYLNE
jgi:peptidoglycan-associated lipoprotein